MRTTSRWAWVFATAVVLLAGAALIPELLEPPCQSPQWAKHEVEPALLEDLTHIAKDEGISTKEAVRRYEWQGDFSNDVTCLEHEYPRTYSFADAGYPPTVRFKGEAPENIHDAFANLPPHVTVRIVETAPYSAREMQHLLDVATAAADAEVGDSGDVVLPELDEETGAISIDLGRRHGRPRTTASAVKARVESRIARKFPFLDPPRVVVRVPRQFPWATTL